MQGKRWHKSIVFKRQAIESLQSAGVGCGRNLWAVKNKILKVMLADNGIAIPPDGPRVGPAEAEELRAAELRRAKKKRASKDFYASKEWQVLRYAALKKHGAVCQCCGASRNDGARLHVDHIKPRSKYPELELDINNLQVLCEPCNMGKGAWDKTDWRGG